MSQVPEKEVTGTQEREPPETDPDQTQALLAINFVADAAKQMLESSTSVSEVVERTRRVLPAAGLEGGALDANLSLLVVSHAPDRNAAPITTIREVEIGEPRLSHLAGASTLLDELENGTVTLEEAVTRLRSLESGEGDRRVARIAMLISVVGWVLFAGGSDLMTLLVAVAAAALTFPISNLVRSIGLPSLIATFLTAGIVASIPNLIAAAGISILIGPAVVGPLFIYLPGREFVSSVIDGLNNATMSSLARGLQAFVTAGFLAIGMLVGSRIGIGAGHGLDYQPDVSAIPPILSIGGVLLGVLGIAVAWGMPRRQLGPTVAMSVAAWLVVAFNSSRGEGSGWWAYALGAGVLGVAGYVAGGIQRAPASSYTGVAILPLVPGFTLYAGMLAWARGDGSLAASTLGGAGVIAIAIAVALAIGLALGRNTVRAGGWVRTEVRGLRRPTPRAHP